MTDSTTSWFKTGLLARCPRCGEGPLFLGYLTLRDKCAVCELSYDRFDSADGPAVFVMFVAGAIVVAAAAFVELAFQPPYWLHMVLWIPFAGLLSFVLLRPFKGIMIALQYVNDAAEGRLVTPEEDET